MSKFIVPLELLNINTIPSLPTSFWTKLYFRNDNLKLLRTFEKDVVLDRPLDALSLSTCSNITASDTVIQAFGKLQCQLNNISVVQLNADWNATSGVQEILNKPVLSLVATSGQYSDLIGLPTIVSPVNADWNAVSGLQEILNKPLLSTVATSGDYLDLINLPSIPSPQVNSDWNATSGISQILNKPNLDLVVFTVELIDALTTNFYAPQNMSINTLTLINGTGTISVLVNASPYVLTTAITQGDTITVTTTTASVVNLNSEFI